MKLPTPDPVALEQCKSLTELIRQEIERSGGYISFARYMELALYAPGLGYYSAGARKFGEKGDFVTAPEISPLFAKCVAKQCQPILAAISHGDILELGAGSGIFAKDLLIELEKLHALPNNYFILEISAELRERQQQFLQTHCPHLVSRIHWLDTLPINGISGIIFANEVMDAMPVHCFRIDENEITERCVTWDKDKFSWHMATPTTPELISRVKAIQEECALAIGYESEVNLMLTAWIATLVNTLKEGVILLFDYGYARHEYYHPDRYQGTLMCYYQHHRHDDPFSLVGLQDMTAHVDFTAVIESATNHGATLAGFTTQASFLLACGLLELASNEKTLFSAEHFQQNQAIKRLTLPSQMGELIKVMGLANNFDLPLLGFSLHDRRRDL